MSSMIHLCGVISFIGVLVMVMTNGLGNNKTNNNRIKFLHPIKYMYAPIYEKSDPCFWLKNFKRQYKLCKADPGMANILLKARRLAIKSCEDQFRYSRWNCSRPGKTFKNVYRETALLYAMAGSALTYSVARACADGYLNNCTCGKDSDYKNNIAAWKWGLCSDNIKYGNRFSKKFFQVNLRGDYQHEILRHDIKVGIHTVINHVRKICKCQGLSGSCGTQICWKRIEPFEKSASVLKEKYQFALLTEIGNKASNTNKIGKVGKARNLLYLVKSPTFCKSTPGRRCLTPDNCLNLCCGRGYNTITKKKLKRCNCKWIDGCCIELKCENCTYYEDEYFCKDEDSDSSNF